MVDLIFPPSYSRMSIDGNIIRVIMMKNMQRVFVKTSKFINYHRFLLKESGGGEDSPYTGK